MRVTDSKEEDAVPSRRRLCSKDTLETVDVRYGGGSWMTNHPPSVLRHCWLGHQTCKYIIFIVCCQVTVDQQLCECQFICEQLKQERDDVTQELGRVKDELTSEKQLRLNVCTTSFTIVTSNYV